MLTVNVEISIFPSLKIVYSLLLTACVPNCSNETKLTEQHYCYCISNKETKLPMGSKVQKLLLSTFREVQVNLAGKQTADC